jgi:hypothetical protein
MCKVFISCGQASSPEIRVAQKVGGLLKKRGFQFYVAKEVQTVFEINSEIIRELKASDCYLFINFRRDKIGAGKYRGSLFSNQEFAIAYALGFQKILVINQKGVLQEGMLRYIGCNTKEFHGYADCLDTVKRALDQANWKADYFRCLKAGKVHLSEEVLYRDQAGGVKGRIATLEIHNGRPDMAALETSGRLNGFWDVGSRKKMLSSIRSAIKATGRPGYSHTILPNSHEAFDLFCVGRADHLPNEDRLYLNSALDLIPKPALDISWGTWKLEYQFHAVGFPLLSVVIRLEWPQNGLPSASVASQEAL